MVILKRRRLYALKHAVTRRLFAPTGEVKYFKSKEDAREFRNSLAADPKRFPDAYLIVLGPDHKRF